MFEIKKDPTRIHILATGAGHELAPRDTNAVVYALNDYVYTERYQIIPDMLFMMDSLEEKPQVISGAQNLGETIQRVNQMKIPFVGPYKYEEIPLSEAFPLEEAVKEFGFAYFTNTICYMIAYAILKGAKEIHLYGVNQAGSSEYTEERGGVEAWLGFALGRGIQVTINGKNSQLFRYKGRYGEGLLYGYGVDYHTVMENNKRFGETIIKKLLKPRPPYSRTMRSFKAK